MIVRGVAKLAEFQHEKMGKTTVVAGESLFVGLNSFEPGQEHSAHTHAGQDKLYVILDGTAEVQIGEEQAVLAAGDAAFASSGVVHAIRNPGPGRLVAMAILAPPPKR
ncbi:MAG: cupin domain-containing protein [Bryobacterales bacterium]|nr:cupin domain-containing protein [Bryobacterales bacterium]